jgi:hypothetical protein
MIRSNATLLKPLVYFFEHIQRTTDDALAFERATMLVHIIRKYTLFENILYYDSKTIDFGL